MSTLTGLIGGGGGDVVQSQLCAGSQGAGTNNVLTMIPALSVPVSSTWQTVLSLSTSGYLWNCLILAGSTSFTGIRITIDGTQVYSAGPLTHGDNNQYYQIWPPAIQGSTTAYDLTSGLAASPLRFESSLLIEGYEGSGSIIIYPGYSID